jgi:hypothetical protein
MKIFGEVQTRINYLRILPGFLEKDKEQLVYRKVLSG